MRKKLRLVVMLLVLPLSYLFAQERPVVGTVTDEAKIPLQGVTVLNRATNKSTQTDPSGLFKIVAAPGQELLLTFVGYQSTTFKVGDNEKFTIIMNSVSRELQEVTVAYGIKKKPRELGYQAPTVSGKEIAETQRDNFFNSLAGRIPGATITSTSGAPGASSSIVLRGGTSIGGNNQPLIVVDGVPIDNTTLNQEALLGSSASGGSSMVNRNSDYSNRAMDINPNDIESLTVLKGPEATALYGADGAAGALIITTKKGRSGAGNISYDNSFRTEKVYRFPEVQTTYGRGLNGVGDPNAVVNPLLLGNLYAFFGPKYPEGTKFYDNFGSFFKTGFTQKHNVSLEGGSEMSTYRLSASYTGQDGVVPTTDFNSLNFRLTGSTKLKKNLTATSSFTYVNSTTNKASKGMGGFLLTLLNWPSDDDASNYMTPEGNRKLLRGNSTATTEYDNPFWDIHKNPAQDKVTRTTGNIQLSYDPTSWWNLSVATGVDAYTQNGFYDVHPESRYGFPSNGLVSNYVSIIRNFSGNIRSTFKKDIGKFSNSLTVGYSFDDNKSSTTATRGEKWYEKNFYGINNTDPLTRIARVTDWRIRKSRIISNLSIGYDELVYLSLSYTSEGNSTLMSSYVDKWPYYGYGGGSLSFVFSDLPVFKNLSWLSYGKARFSYAATGKGPVVAHIIDATMESQITTGGGYAYGVTGNNQGLQPEYTNTLEYGAELRFFNDRLGIDIARYSQRNKDQILAARASYGTGFIIKWLNGGLVENRGIEIQLTGTPVKTRDLKWDITANFDRNVGQVLEMPANLPTYYDSDTWVFGNLRSQLYKGAFTSNLSGYGYRRNNKGDILISTTTGMPLRTLDFETVGDRSPDFKIGFINSIRYKNFNLSFNLDLRKGGDVFNGNEYLLYLTGLSKRTLDREKNIIFKGVLADGLENTAHPTPNNIAVNPYYKSDYFGTDAVPEGDFIEEVDWLRLRDVTLSYNLPQSLLSRQKVFKNVSVFVTGTDLFIITNYSGADPAVNANTAYARGFGGAGIDYGSLATPRAINFGVRVQL
jgi:ferric enterobactin receptor